MRRLLRRRAACSHTLSAGMIVRALCREDNRRVGSHADGRSCGAQRCRLPDLSQSIGSARFKWKLFFHRAERQHDFAKDFVQHLRQSGVNCGEAAEHSFVAGEMFEAGAGVGEIADGQ